MKLREHLKHIPRADREAMAIRCGTTLGHLTNVSYGYKECGPALAVAIEQDTVGAVTRKDLRPSDWRAIWPELAKPAHKAKPTTEAA